MHNSNKVRFVPGPLGVGVEVRTSPAGEWEDAGTLDWLEMAETFQDLAMGEHSVHSLVNICVDDVFMLRPSWTLKRALRWMWDNLHNVQDYLIGASWESMESVMESMNGWDKLLSSHSEVRAVCLACGMDNYDQDWEWTNFPRRVREAAEPLRMARERLGVTVCPFCCESDEELVSAVVLGSNDANDALEVLKAGGGVPALRQRRKREGGGGST
jgi:hypothetical protein